MKHMSRILLMFVFLSLCSNLFAEKILIKRSLICLYNSLQHEDSFFNNLHQRIETELNYYGYFCDYFDVNDLPENADKYAGIIYWASSNQLKDPVYFYKWLVQNIKKGKKVVLLGDIPTRKLKQDLTKQINEILKKNFGFYIGDYWYNNKSGIKIEEKNKIFDFEMPLLSGTVVDFRNILISSKYIKPLLELSYKDRDLLLKSFPVFIAPWGAFGIDDKIFYTGNKQNRWLINPFEFVKMIFNTRYPIPETTTINGKRILYIHMDGDGANSISEVDKKKNCAEIWYDKIGKKFPDFKTGVSFIGADLDPKYVGSTRAQKIARKIFALPNVEPASHTYTHPLSWSKALVAFIKKGEKEEKALYGNIEHIKAFRSKAGEVDHEYEIVGSMKYISKFCPKNKQVKVLYWSGDCLPTKADLETIEKNNFFAINNGDTFFDLKHNSYFYVTPIARDVHGIKQIYSSNSNENVYTELWTENFWGFKNVIVTFKKTGYPIRIKPVNLYYHFYSVEKIASYNALVFIYRYLERKKEQFNNIFPSQFIKIVKNFFSVRIYSIGNNKFLIENSTDLKEFRFEGKVKIKPIRNITAVHYNKKLNVTYITLGKEKVAELEVY